MAPLGLAGITHLALRAIIVSRVVNPKRIYQCNDRIPENQLPKELPNDFLRNFLMTS